MKFKDDTLLKEAYSSIIKEEVGDDLFFAKDVNVDIMYEDYDSNLYIDDSRLTSDVSYSIEIEYRSWGIKGIYAHVMKVFPVSFYVTNEETDEEKYITIVPSEGEVEVDSPAGSICTDDTVVPRNIEITLGKDFKPIKTVVEF